MRRISALLLCLVFAVSAVAQQPQAKSATPTPAQQTTTQPQPTANPEDVQSIDAILGALYDVISGPPGERNWKRFHSLFIPEAIMVATGKRPDGTMGRRVITPKDYEERSGKYFLSSGFFERSTANKISQFGEIAHVFSGYESRHEKDGKPFARGINSIQLINDGTRWWIVSIMWTEERPDLPLPAEFSK